MPNSTLILKGGSVEIKNSIKYLRVTFDKKLNFKQFFDYITEQ